MAHRLIAMGYPVGDLPPVRIFRALCCALRVNGYNTEESAKLLYACFHDDRQAKRALLNKAGAIATLIFGEPE